MNFAVTLVSAILLLLSGCAVREQAVVSKQPQELIKMSPLPALTSPVPAVVRLRVLFRVLSDGTVAEVRVLKSSGDTGWDASAVDSMRRWRFSTVPQDTVSGGRLFLYLLVVHAEAPIVMTLGELVAAREQEADSLYALLKSGVAFDAIAKQIAVGSSGERGGFLGPVNIAIYPEQVRDELRTLSVNDFTHPIRLGNNYMIYVRFENDGSRNLVP